MRPFHVTLLLLSVAALACAGDATDDDDQADTDPFDLDDDTGNGGADDDGESYEQTAACADYLECLAATRPDEVDDAEDRYGEHGTCWDGDQDEASACDDACDDLYDALADDYPEEEACGGKPDDTGNTDDSGDTGEPADTGDTGEPADTGDTGSSGGCALDEGDWTLDLAFDTDTCGAADYGSVLPVTVACTSASRGEFTIAMTFADFLPVTLDCAGSSSFTCSGTDSMGLGLTIGLDGAASGGGTRADGDWEISIPSFGCASAGTFTAAL